MRANFRATAKLIFQLGIAIAMLAAISAMVTPAGAQQSATEVRPPKLDFTKHTLANGLQVVMLEEHSVPVINLQVWYHVGSKDEQPGHTGFAHLFEHLMFKGSAHVGPDEHSRIIEAMGGFDNAETNDDTTDFLRDVPEQLSRARAVARSGPHGQPQRGRGEFQVRARSGERRAARARGQPAVRPLEEDLARRGVSRCTATTTRRSAASRIWTRRRSRTSAQFLHTYYKPNNATLVIVGDFNSAQALAWAKKYFEGIPASVEPDSAASPQPEPPQTAERDGEQIVFEHAAARRS